MTTYAELKGRALGSLVEHVEFFRLDASRKLDTERRSAMGQYFTPPLVAQLMASMFELRGDHRIRLLDAGAGVGSLTASWIAELCARAQQSRAVDVTAFELDFALSGYLKTTLALCGEVCSDSGIEFNASLRQEDFIEAAVSSLRGGLFEQSKFERFDCAILNPPYRKINSDSRTRRHLSAVGIETSNLYTAFLSLAIRLLEPGGELVAITPRSFCNGPYFKPFRKEFLRSLTLKRVHVYESRNRAFSEDEVLQENVIVHAVKLPSDSSRVFISSSMGPEDEHLTMRELERDEVVRRGDPNHFIHIVPDELGHRIARRMTYFKSSLSALSVTVSTGRVVDFRAQEYLRGKPSKTTAPLIYPAHFDHGRVRWPKADMRKPTAIAVSAATDGLLVPSGVYVLVKRFSSKEEKRRIVAAVFDPIHVKALRIGFENHLNYFHRNGAGLPRKLARGLAAFLNSTLVDAFFRQFNGHTQVNATDLRSLHYPSEDQLVALGTRIGRSHLDQDELDRLIEEELIQMPDEQRSADPVRAKKRIEEALMILKALGLPREQQNERSALTLLALLDLRPETSWSEASNPLMGITPMMEFFREHYGKTYAPNTRETVRRQTVHQFLDAGLVVANPDDPERAVNSPKAVYQIESGALEMLKGYGTEEWEKDLHAHLASAETLKARYAREREMKRIPVSVAEGTTINLTPGGQNVLVEKIIDEFCQRFTAGGRVIYVGDTGEKFAYFDEKALADLGVKIEEHGKMPDVVIHHREKDWLVLIEAVTSHGPVSAKRRRELERLFAGSRAGLVYVTAFLDRKTMVRYLGDISWETEVWVAESPSHMIHFNGERFLGPY